MNKTTILVIEDEAPMRRFLRAALVSHDFFVLEAENAKDAVATLTTHAVDLVLLDLGLPDRDGIDLTKEVRDWCKAPIIVISARGREEDKVNALDAGADDYVTKPFGVGELLARMRVALRHASQANSARDPQKPMEFGALKIDVVRRQVSVDDKEVHLTPLEYKMLVLLATHEGRVLTHRQILKEVWGAAYAAQSHYLRVFMAQLRRKLETDPAQPRWLITEPGVGYRLRGDSPSTN